MNLLTARPQRVHFNPKNKAHVASLKTFIETGTWGEVKFACEGSYLSVPEYVMRKFISHQLKCNDVVLNPIPTKAAAVEDEVVAPIQQPLLLLAA